MTTHPVLALLVLIDLAIALLAFAFAFHAWRTTRRAVAQTHTHARVRPEPVDERSTNLGAPRATGERRQEDRGPAARHRAPDELGRARRRDADAPQWQTQQLPAVDDATAEHRAVRPLPPPGTIR